MGSIEGVRDAIGGQGTRDDERSAGGRPAGVRAVEQCFDCGRDLPIADSCTTATIAFPDGVTLRAIRYGEEEGMSAADRCPGCDVRPGGYHHPFCPVEACPQCGGRLAVCRCLDADKTR
jgi:hypothetical protein